MISSLGVLIMAELTGLDYTNAIKLEFEKLQAENTQLKAQLAEAMELLEIAVGDRKFTLIKGRCYICKHAHNHCDDCTEYDEFVWQYSDRYEKLKSEVEK